MATILSCLGIPETTQNISFLNIDIEKDTQMFIDPLAIILLKSSMGHEMKQEVQNYFSHLIGLMKD